MAGQGNEEEEGDKPLDASEQKIRKAREKGDVPITREAGNLMSAFALLIIFVMLMPAISGRLLRALEGALAHAGQVDLGPDGGGVADLSALIYDMAWDLSLAMGPVFAALLVGGLISITIQGPLIVTLERIKPKLSKVSPLAGLKRLFSKNTLVEFVKNVTKVLVVGLISTSLAYQAVQRVWQTDLVLPERIGPFLTDWVVQILAWVLLFLAVITLADVLWQRHSWAEKQKMSHKEMRDEMKDAEGDPMLKAKREGIRRQRAMQRAATAVPMANVILTNPTHYAVALRYTQGEDMAPVCVAKGADLMAAQIRRIARENDVPIIENRPLARALYETVELDRTIPTEHWQAVAEIIGFLLDLKARRRRKPPTGSSFRIDP
jgi:flagellar biosynthetic protein FlhB